MNFGGNERLVLNYLQLISRDRFSVHFASFTTNGGLLNAARAAADHYVAFLRSYRIDYHLILSLRNYLITNHIHLVQTNNLMEAIYMNLACLGLPVRQVLFVHERPDPRRCFLFRWLTVQLDRIICVSDYVRGRLLQMGCSYNKIEVIRGGIDIERFACYPSPLWQQDEFVLCMVARFCQEKDHETVLRAIARLYQCQGTKYRVVFAGGGDSRLMDEQRALAVRLGIIDRVCFLGPQIDIAHTLYSSSCLVASSRSEGLGLAVLEAMACALPVIASDIPTHREMLGNGQYGQLFCIGDAQDLADKIKLLAENEDVWVKYSLVAKSRAREYDIRESIIKFEECMISLLYPHRKGVI